MKRTLTMTAVLALTALLAGAAQDSKPAEAMDYSADVASIDSAIAALYDVISGPAGPRDWDRFRNLFHHDGRLISTGYDREGNVRMRTMTPDDYVDGSGAWLEENGFFERELSRKLDRFGLIAHAFSTYESRGEADGPVTARGINSIQLISDGEHWRVLNIFWTGESEKNPLPEKYLP